MKQHFFLFALVGLVLGCQSEPKTHQYTHVSIKTVFEDSVSIRAIEFLDTNTLAFAGSKGVFGTINLATEKIRANTMEHHAKTPAFRAVAKTSTDFFMLSIDSPALLYKTGDAGRMELVYEEEGEGVFYDSMKFWNDKDGIAIGDEVEGCLSIVITKDGGQTWKKVSCDMLPQGIDGEGAFAASNTNIEIKGDVVWVATTSGRVYISRNKGETWHTAQTPVVNEKETQGIYSIDFYDDNLGFGIGGDYTAPNANISNKILTEDGGETWKSIADGQAPGYKSCVQFVPNSGGNDLVAVGFTGIDYSNNGGVSWRTLSEEGFYTVQFLNDSIAYAAGKNRIARLVFK